MTLDAGMLQPYTQDHLQMYDRVAPTMISQRPGGLMNGKPEQFSQPILYPQSQAFGYHIESPPTPSGSVSPGVREDYGSMHQLYSYHPHISHHGTALHSVSRAPEYGHTNTPSDLSTDPNYMIPISQVNVIAMSQMTYPKGLPSPTNSIYAQTSGTTLRFEAILEAATAATQRPEEIPLTYLNKGQYYCINLKDNEGRNEQLKSTIKITFQDAKQRQNAPVIWRFWVGLQKDKQNPRAIEIDVEKSTKHNATKIESLEFDTCSFSWNGAQGAKVFVKFCCLSTDFSRIKGVKGIPLRIQMDTKSEQDVDDDNIERSYCQVKLFRDKGAERKNKDDARHLEKQLEKSRGKNGETQPLWLIYGQPQATTVFQEVGPEPTPCSEADSVSLDSGLARDYESQESSDGSHLNSGQLTPLSRKRDRNDSGFSGDCLKAVDYDPDYNPLPKRRRAVLCLLVLFPKETTYRAIYLESYTVQDLIAKICSKMNMDPSKVAKIRRWNQAKSIYIAIDDEVVDAMEDETSMEVDQEPCPEGVQIILKY